MTSDDTTTVLDAANEAAVRMMLEKLTDHDVTVVYNNVGGIGPISDVAAQAMKDRNIDL